MKAEYSFWKDAELRLGYLEEYPDYHTQGNSLEELQGNLKDLYNYLSTGQIHYARKKGELEVA